MVKAAALHEGRKDLEVALRLCETRRFTSSTATTARRTSRPTCSRSRNARRPARDPTLLGDIVISVDTAKRQAKKGLYAELLHLASHGLCHLLGYDHRDDEEERVMNARAAALRKEAARTGRVRAA